MATTTGNDYPSTDHLTGVSEASVWDNMDQSPTCFAGNEDECGCQTEGCNDCMQDAVGRQADADAREAAALDSMCQPAKHIRDVVNNARYENLTLTVRELEAAIARRDGELVEKRAQAIADSNYKRDAEAAITRLQDDLENYRTDLGNARFRIAKLAESGVRKSRQIVDLESRVEAFEKDMAGTMASLEASQWALKLMTETAELASTDADKHMDNARDLSDLLSDSGKREDRAHETIMGIRALAESNMLTDAEKVALILRLA